MDEKTLNLLRYTLYRILMPCVVTIGILGNLVSVVVLTRRRMRCSTNIYLTALAVADIIYLIFIFILSFERYPHIHDQKYKIYWSTFGLTHWFCDAATVAFLCFALSISTAFEYKLEEKIEYYNKSSGALCTNVSDAFANNNDNVTLKPISLENIDGVIRTTTESDLTEEYVSDAKAFYDYNDDNRITKRDAKLWNIDGVFYNRSEIQSICEKRVEIHGAESEFGMNEIYRNVYYPFTTAVFTFIPLILLTTFNCFLVAVVHRSHKIRRTMTNTRQSDRSTAQENKVTVTLIAVVVLFLLCQTPMAIQLIFTINMENEAQNYLHLAFNNICNFLVAVNAALNFVLYCALSDKYRKTFKELFFGRKTRRENTLTSTYFSRYGSNPTGTTVFSKSPGSLASDSIRNRSKNSRFSITPTDYANFQAEMAVKNANTKSLAAADFKTEKNSPQNSSHIQMQPLRNESSAHPPSPLIQQLSPSSRKLRFHISPTETSLTRAQSLVFPIKTKHSPNCKNHPNS